ncbi:hypothetical protein MPSI1_002150 [Malassezia psittaci]|uniref:SAC3/GANP/THP3 conserved domain-containing protein n=1 Tax=Malassezia psittaci TaxID=1821823 RepID=A0AAF0F687_9BASI|nr:hypothetical protein MPSI1_002150 [Malassezia psittaci]
MASGGDWPASLREFANHAFAACTDANRKQVSDELKALIFAAFQDGSLHTKDWSRVQLTSLALKSNDKKRRMDVGGGGTISYAEKARPVSHASTSGGTRVPPGPPPPPIHSIRTQASQTRAPVPTMPHTDTTTEPGPRSKKKARKSPSKPMLMEDPSRKAMRLRRFEEEQLAFEREQEQDMQAALATTSLAGRLGSTSQAGSHPFAVANDPNVIDWDEFTVVGTSAKLEKPYLRLTSAPDPKMVRPLSTLQKTLSFLLEKWHTEHNYAYICDQFKSVRQDLTVQRIKNDFTVKVYETHARIALEMRDLGEYNQCQTQLRGLYTYGLGGHPDEFLAYRILYLLHTRNQREVSALMTELTPEIRAEPAVEHALAVRKAMRTGNYHALFCLYRDAPNMNASIMIHFIERERVQALLVLAKSLRPSCPLAMIRLELGWDSYEDMMLFLEQHDAAIFAHDPQSTRNKPTHWDTKQAIDPLTRAAERFRKVDIKGQLS